MKSLRDYSMNLAEQEYHTYPAWSYSKIAKYAKEGFSAIATLHDPVVPTPSMEFGSLFDTILTKGKKGFEAEYVISDTVPTPAEKNVLDCLLTMTNKPFYDIPSFTIQEALESCNYKKCKEFEKQYKHLEEFKDYYEARREGKRVVNSDDFKEALEMANIFKNDTYLSSLFGSKNTDEVEYIYQAQFKITHKDLIVGQDIDIKIMPDLLVVNHKEKTVQPVDLKTSSIPGWSFEQNFVKFRYDIQASLYSDVLRMIMDNDENYVYYKILPYLFTDISRSDKIPVTWKYDQNDISQDEGLSFKDYKYKGYKQLLKEILEYEKTEAKVPSYVTTEGPNDLISILSR